MSPLPGAVSEADTISGLLKCEALTGAAATKAAVLERLAHASVIHLATHGVVDGLGARLLLHGEPTPSEDSAQWLRPEDIMTDSEDKPRRLSTQLAVLSACNSGRGQVMSGEGVVGLARALMATGVRTVVVALWPLPDDATLTLMKQFYELATGEEVDVGAALRAAFLALDATIVLPELASADDSSGCTAIVVIVTPTHLVCASAGDSRAWTMASKSSARPRSNSAYSGARAANAMICEYSRGTSNIRTATPQTRNRTVRTVADRVRESPRRSK